MTGGDVSDFTPGLEGVIAFETQIAEPDKAGGALRYRGVDIEDLIGDVSFGNVWAVAAYFLASAGEGLTRSWFNARTLWRTGAAVAACISPPLGGPSATL